MSFDVTALPDFVKENQELMYKTQSVSGLAEIASIQSGVKGKQKINIFDTVVTFGDGGCNVTYTDSTVFSQREIAVADMNVSEKLCISDLEGKMTQMLLKQGKAGAEEHPFEQQWLESKMNKIALEIAKADIQGNATTGTGNLGKYDGLLKIVADAGASVVDGTNGETSVTSANILDVIEHLVSVIPEEIRDRQDLVLLMPWNYYYLYTSALKTANLYHFIGGDGETKFYGTNITLKPMTGFNGVDDMILTYGENIVVGLDAESDEEDFSLRLSSDSGARNTMLFDIIFKRGVQVAYPDRIVKFHI